MKQSEAIRWLNETEVAELTGRAKQTLRNDRCRGRGCPYYKIGGSVRYKLDEVITFMDAHRIVPVNTMHA